jgi:hypothetical protein
MLMGEGGGMKSNELPVPSESVEQQCLFRWAMYNTGKYPELNGMYHIPNGGKRGKAEAARFKTEGVKKGMPDICLPVARGEHHALYIEMKRRKGGQLSQEQKEKIAWLIENGNRVEVCKGWEAAVEVIKGYLALPSLKKGDDDE